MALSKNGAHSTPSRASPPSGSNHPSFDAAGTYADGKADGNWKFPESNGSVWEGPYVEGKLHGHRVWRGTDGSLYEGPYVDGRRHGRWIERLAGTDGVQVHMTNTSNLPIEALENEYPLMIERYELVQDSGGAGTWRGGLGLRRIYRPIGHVVNFSGQGERCVNAPWGVFGGGPGATGRFELCSDAGGVTRIANKPSSLEVGPDMSIVVTTAGAGGYGPPAERTAGALADDRRSGKFSPGYLERAYGVSE